MAILLPAMSAALQHHPFSDEEREVLAHLLYLQAWMAGAEIPAIHATQRRRLRRFVAGPFGIALGQQCRALSRESTVKPVRAEINPIASQAIYFLA